MTITVLYLLRLSIFCERDFWKMANRNFANEFLFKIKKISTNLELRENRYSAFFFRWYFNSSPINYRLSLVHSIFNKNFKPVSSTKWSTSRMGRKKKGLDMLEERAFNWQFTVYLKWCGKLRGQQNQKQTPNNSMVDSYSSEIEELFV